MHFEILIEDNSGKEAMSILAPKLLCNGATFTIHHYKGLGRTPKSLCPHSDPSKRKLLTELPRLLRGYGRVPNIGTIVIICDLDDRNKDVFLSELNAIYNSCNPKPNTVFCLCIEEFEAWYFGDLKAIKTAYPNAKDTVLNRYSQDSICGTWELLADAIYKGGHETLAKKGWQVVGAEKAKWAREISPHMNVEDNASPSFHFLRSQFRNTITSNVYEDLFSPVS